MFVKSPAVLADVCVKCGNRTGNNRFSKKLRYVNPLVLLWLLLSPGALLIAYLCFRKTAYIEYSRCRSCSKRRNLYRYVAYSGWGVLVFGIFLGNNFPNFGATFAPLFLPTLIVAIAASYISSNEIRIRKCRPPHYDLAGVHPDVENCFDEATFTMEATRGW